MANYPNYSNSNYQAPNSSTAIISLVAGILGLTFLPLIGSIVAIIAGSRAKTEIAQSGGTLGGEGMATAGVVMGWIGIALSALGCCIAAVMILFSMGMFGIALQDMGSLLPAVMPLVF